MWQAYANDSTRQQDTHCYSLGWQSSEALDYVFIPGPGIWRGNWQGHLDDYVYAESFQQLLGKLLQQKLEWNDG